MFRRTLVQLMSNAKPFTFKPSQQTSSFGPSVWLEFSPLSVKHKSVNLGQGFPDFEPADFVRDALIKTIEKGGLNQYTRSAGHPRLVNALSKFYSPYFNRDIDPMTEIVTSVGASEALFCTIQSVVNPGDEVILIEPFFDIYLGAVLMAGGVPKYVSLKEEPRVEGKKRTADGWKLDINEFEQAFSDKTKLVILNNPHNPVGKVFKLDELTEIAEVVKKHPQTCVISDEVYEWMTYDNAEHLRFANIPGMWERTITIGSAGKTFSITGWKVGWCIGPKPIIHSIAMAHQYIPFSVPTPTQEAVAIAFEEAPARGYFDQLKKMYQAKRDQLVSALADSGLDPVIPQGAYFIMGDISKIKLFGDQGQNTSITGMGKHLHDWNVCRWLTTDIGVTAIPPSSFYSDEHAPLSTNYARFCFCKKEEVLETARQNLLKVKDTENYQK
ncbi:hypothetical protein CYY_007780 [Polysphondylium violaceum]|uniref:kynurenine--oxoglutarate transaminase n=1 Tax=Polysphondylium violaceum TaxID=133409 RepID=A0A8J4PPT0_9MYCE|nr:hypothetical protein CYY_007780 [Polysphondylium violaceum]